MKIPHPTTGKAEAVAGWDAVKAARDETSQAERLRLYYVAMTRARDALTLWVPQRFYVTAQRAFENFRPAGVKVLAGAPVLEKGMVLALEPHVNFWHVQDMILVTDGAPVLLSAKFNTDHPFIAG